jgi:hypothetical protein
VRAQAPPGILNNPGGGMPGMGGIPGMGAGAGGAGAASGGMGGGPPMGGGGGMGGGAGGMPNLDMLPPQYRQMAQNMDPAMV